MKWLMAVVVAVAAGGCASDPDEGKEKASMRARQDAALKDPFNYNSGVDRTDISGGGMMDLKNDAFKRDLDSAFSP